jgi:hypothetical protein
MKITRRQLRKLILESMSEEAKSDDKLRDQINDLAARLLQADIEDEFDGDFNMAAIKAAEMLGPRHQELEANAIASYKHPPTTPPPPRDPRAIARQEREDDEYYGSLRENTKRQLRKQ